VRQHQNTFHHHIRANRVELETPSAAVAVVSLIGEHDLAEYEPLKEALDLAASRRRHVIIDLSNCAFVCSTVISLLLHAQGEVVSDGGRFGVVIPPASGAVSRVAELMGLESLFPVHASLETARSGLSPSSGWQSAAVQALVPAGPDYSSR
jgi:anti-anti-sigma factor